MSATVDAVNQALSHIEYHLTDKLKVGDVADAIHYSKYHLHRAFSSTLGITMHNYIQRRQLTEAAKLLVYSDAPITDVVQISGFDSQQAFSTVFKSMYKVSPKQFRDYSQYYPLQLAYHFGEHRTDSGFHSNDIEFATLNDMESWMELVKLVIDGYPCWQQDEYEKMLKIFISQEQAFILKNADTAIGIMCMNQKTGNIDFLGVHPFYKSLGIDKLLIETAKDTFLNNRQVSITTYRKGDRADTGFRKAIIDMGFREAELLLEFGYPTQRFVL